MDGKAPPCFSLKICLVFQFKFVFAFQQLMLLQLGGFSSLVFFIFDSLVFN